MKVRLNYGKVAPGVYDAMDALDRYLQDCELERALIMLVQLRVSQINGCAYCLDMHWKDLCAIGEREQRLYSLDGHVPDGVYDVVRPHFSDKELSDLTLAVAAINAWNRLSIAGRLTPGTYQPAQVTASRSGRVEHSSA
jgi:AhpD family alkylhydroperoxidase